MSYLSQSNRLCNAGAPSEKIWSVLYLETQSGFKIARRLSVAYDARF